ncbi:uncharacterized protein LOC131658980 [Vicia villosa]|uniref:uncharacterized protein LOC131658980 n=1 Tax=Vicia villosa TaxID=3911 RepID=UPI00273ACDD8|nr:uncharacterized protein LOC131658980 [Vicia villosa]
MALICWLRKLMIGGWRRLLGWSFQVRKSLGMCSVGNLLELTQGNKSVTEYAAKFTELIKFYPHFDGEGAEFSKCIKFQNGLRSEIKKAVGYQKIRLFSDLVDSCRIFEEDSNAHHKMVSDRRGKNQQSRGKPYDAGKGKQRVTHGQRSSGGDAPARIVCFKCGQPGHKSNACTADARKFKTT